MPGGPCIALLCGITSAYSDVMSLWCKVNK